MGVSKHSSLTFIKTLLWGAIFFSALAVVYHIRWFIPFLLGRSSRAVPDDQIPVLWFTIQICNNLIFLFAGFLLLRIFRKYQRTGFLDLESLKVFDGIIISCIGLGLLGAIKTIANNIAEVHLEDWNSIYGITNLLFRAFTELIIFKEPQTMYLLIALLLWPIKQFITTSWFIKNENEAFI